MHMDVKTKLILLDVEGTVSPLTFVHDVLFPFARQHVAEFLSINADAAPIQNVLDQMARDEGKDDFTKWCPYQPPSAQATKWVVNEVNRLMDIDAKKPGLKALQGLVWEQGFHSGTLQSVVFPDVPAALATWTSAGRQVRIYSSGSVQAQKLFFTHTDAGDLSIYLSGYYDTTTGPKRESKSYSAIALNVNLPPGEILFLSDVPEELDAARTAGFATGLTLRPGNRAVPHPTHPIVNTFDEIELR